MGKDFVQIMLICSVAVKDQLRSLGSSPGSARSIRSDSSNPDDWRSEIQKHEGKIEKAEKALRKLAKLTPPKNQEQMAQKQGEIAELREKIRGELMKSSENEYDWLRS